MSLNLLNDPFTGRSLIEASAGTGKTWTLTALYARLLLERRLNVGQILVVTYTTAATAELRERIRARLAALLAMYEGAPARCNLFGNLDSKNSYYVDLSATFDTGVWGLSVTPHIGYQKVKNNSGFSYTDYSVTVAKEFMPGLTGSVMLVDTDNDNYLAPNGKNLGKSGVVLGVKYAF